MLLREQLPQQTQFSTSNPENLILVENRGTRVLIRAARDNFSRPRKSCFIRELAAEGYIPGRYEGLTNLEVAGGVNWVIDHSWVETPSAVRRRTNRFMFRLIGSSFLLWLALMVLAFLRAPR